MEKIDQLFPTLSHTDHINLLSYGNEKFYDKKNHAMLMCISLKILKFLQGNS